MPKTKNPKMEILSKTKKILTSDFSLGNNGGWGRVYQSQWDCLESSDLERG